VAYATLLQVRDEGVSVAMASDARVTALLDQASTRIDNINGSWFESRAETITKEGPGTKYLHLHVPIITVTQIDYVERFSGVTTTVAAANYLVYTAVKNPVIRNLVGDWNTGPQAYDITGTFGWLEDSATPDDITTACIMLVIRGVPQLADEDAALERRTGDLKQVVVQGRSESWGTGAGGVALSLGGDTGDAEIDRLLAPYHAPKDLLAI